MDCFLVGPLAHNQVSIAGGMHVVSGLRFRRCVDFQHARRLSLQLRVQLPCDLKPPAAWLIAAAPDLLATLERILARVETFNLFTERGEQARWSSRRARRSATRRADEMHEQWSPETIDRGWHCFLSSLRRRGLVLRSVCALWHCDPEFLIRIETTPSRFEVARCRLRLTRGWRGVLEVGKSTGNIHTP